MAIINSDDDMMHLQNEIQRERFSSSAWIGMYHANSWHWSLGYEPLGALKIFAPGEPNNSGGKQDCIALKSSMGWSDRTCTDVFPFMCFDGKMFHTFHIVIFSLKIVLLIIPKSAFSAYSFNSFTC